MDSLVADGITLPGDTLDFGDMVADGGTGVANLTIGNIIIGNGTNGLQSVCRGSIVAGDSSVVVTNGADTTVGSNVTIEFNIGGIDIAQTSGFLPASRVTTSLSDQWTNSNIPNMDGNPNSGNF